MKTLPRVALVLLTNLLAAAPCAAQNTSVPQADRLFHQPGLIYFWALNDDCGDAKTDHMIDAFVQGGASAVCLHPRPGLLKPYGGDAWFEFVGRTVDRCAERGLDVWLYDEDPYPSGNAGGRLTMEHPEFQALEIKRFEPSPAAETKGLYCFPSGTLLWCGLVNETTRATTDLTSRVGLVRRKWIKLDPWDSRYYYPATPLYKCPRAGRSNPSTASTVAKIPPGSKLLAFVAQPIPGDAWPSEPDRLNPAATRLFLQLTHERYAAVLGDRFGKQIQAIFTDEPKYACSRPWTRDMFPAFKAQFGYDLPPRLWMLFSQTTDADSMLTRLHFRQWCGERFREAWLTPVGRWCREHRLALVGHISPEDDPVQQNDCVTNLLPLHTEFALPGLDLIVPAVGDRDHPLDQFGSALCKFRRPATGQAGRDERIAGLQWTRFHGRPGRGHPAVAAADGRHHAGGALCVQQRRRPAADRSPAGLRPGQQPLARHGGARPRAGRIAADRARRQTDRPRRLALAHPQFCGPAAGRVHRRLAAAE